MSEHQAARTLVKSAPELWMACSEESSLARHLKPFGEIRITRLEPETAVAWEGERASGTVRLEPSGWGTRVTLTARDLAAASQANAEPELAVESRAELAVESQAELAVESQAELAVESQAELAVESQAELAVESPVEPAGESPVEPAVESPFEPEAQVEVEAPEPPIRQPVGFWQRLLGRRRPKPKPEPVLVAAPQPLPAATPEPGLVATPEPGLLATPEPGLVATPEPVLAATTEPVAIDDVQGRERFEQPQDAFNPAAALDAALDSLGRAHHRPFSRG